jgi:hypothetical protein
MGERSSTTPMSRIAIRLHNASEWLAGKSSAYAWQAVGIFVVLVGFVSVVRSLRTTMWVDEFYTYFTSHQASAGEVVKASLEGCDGAPPMYALLTRALHPVLGGGVMNLRFPATLGFCLMCGCVFAFVYRRLPALYAWVAMLFACDSVLYFATEGRAYGLVLGLIALSLVCWQAAAEGKHRPRAFALFVFCMWAATALHYYAILLLIPLFAAEVVRWIIAKRLDVPMIVTFALVPLVLIPPIPLPYQGFVKNHRHFLLAANAQDWLVWHFNRSGFRVTVKGTHWEPGLLEVKSAKL